MPLRREQIAEAALRLLDEVGLEHVTVRRLADALGVQAATLYYHFADKQELLDWMAQAILSPVLSVLETDLQPDHWMEWLAIRAHTLRQALLAHREGARVVAGARFERAEALAAMSNETIKGLLVAGFSLTQARLATKTLLSYLLGFVIEEQALGEAYRQPETPPKESSQFPLLTAVLDEARSTGQNQQTDFEQGLQLFLAGMRAWFSPPT